MKCPVCQSKEFSIIRNKLRYNIKCNVLECKNCSHIFLDNKKDLDNFYKSKEYRKSYGPNLKKEASLNVFFETYYPFQEFYIKEIDKIMNQDMSVLDVGCSTGHFLHALKGKVKQRIGLEISPEYANFARERCDIKVYTESIEKAQIKEAPFDFITCIQVLEHIQNPLLFLKAIGKNLKPGGYLYIDVPNINDVMLKYSKFKEYEDFYYHEPHISYFSIKSLKHLLKNAGFYGDVKTSQKYTIVNHLSWILTKEPQNNYQDTIKQHKFFKPTDYIGKELNNFISQVDDNYKKLLIKHDIGDSLVFIGQKK